MYYIRFVFVLFWFLDILNELRLFYFRFQFQMNISSLYCSLLFIVQYLVTYYSYIFSKILVFRFLYVYTNKFFEQNVFYFSFALNQPLINYNV
jgi:hypothetical protein